MSTFPTYAKISRERTESRESRIRRTQMEAGPPKQTTIKTRALTTQKIKVVIVADATYSATENYERFKDWLDEVGGGWFDFPNHIGGVDVQARIVADSIEEASFNGLGESWNIAMSVEFY